jgi:hypothetical protein
MEIMKRNSLAWFLVILVCVSLSCNVPGRELLELQQINLVYVTPPSGTGSFSAEVDGEAYNGAHTLSCYVSPDTGNNVYTGSVSGDMNHLGYKTFGFNKNFHFSYTVPGAHALVCQLDNSIGNAYSGDFTVTAATQPPVASQVPVASKVPAASEVPAASQIPEASQVPAASQQPVVGQNPLPAIVNPGFEQAANFFDPWSELPSAFQYGGQSVNEATLSHSGSHSRKLFLRYGGSYILQRMPADPALPLNSQLTLSVFVKMPYAGARTNKCFSLELVIGGDAGQQKSARLDNYNALPSWTSLSVDITNPDFPITWIEIHAMTNKGDGSDRASDKPVYVDDFLLSVVPGQP